MGNTLDNLTLNEITLAYAGKNIAQYLRVTAPEAPPEWKKIIRNWDINDAILRAEEKLDSAYLFLFDRKRYYEKKECMAQEDQTRSRLYLAREQDEVEFEEELRLSGITTRPERDAYMVALFAGLGMTNFVYSADESKDGVEIIKRKNGVTKEVRIVPELLEDYLRISVNVGIISLIGKYWIPIEGVKMPQIVNPDFEEKATRWLTKEVYSRTKEGRECKLLEKVVVKRDDGGIFNLRTIKSE